MDMMTRLKQFREDFSDYARNCLIVRDEEGKMVPFELNIAQKFLHDAIEKQKAETGMVRAMVLKGRQQGASTYVAARYYSQASLWTGVNVFILSHEQTASDNLFGMVDRFQRNNPIAPHVGVANAKELEFDKLDSSYAVATAKNNATGRGKSISLFHGSEVAFWPNATEHFAASVQGVPTSPNTEIILESTSAGASGEYYERWLDAEAGRGDYIPIFLPWWLTPRYSRPIPPGFDLLDIPTEEGEMSEVEYFETFDVTLENMVWRRAKMYELRDPLLFRREYPAMPSEAWTPPVGHRPFIDALLVVRARKRPKQRGYGPLIIGVDPASNGGDRFSVCRRRGQVAYNLEYRNKVNHEEAVLWLRNIMETEQPARMNIDAGNIGANIIQSLRNISPWHAEIVRAINFGGTSQSKIARPRMPGPVDRRAEMWARAKEWLESPEGAILPDDNALQTDLTAPKLIPQTNNDFRLESKKQMKDRRVRSPDLADAFALTFAFNEYFSEYSDSDLPRSYGNIDNHSQPQVIQSPLAGNRRGWMG